MREYKFRGKRIYNGEWITGWLVIQPDGTAYISQYFKRGEWVEVDPETVGQYTGLKDMDDKEIYEGDVLDVTSELVTGLGRVRTGKMHTAYYEVRWVGEGWGKKTLKDTTLVVGNVTGGLAMTAEYGIVIGNRWDHPHLLEQGEKE